jgi:hypothetical protein
MFLINPIAKLMQEAVYHAITYRKGVHNYFGTSEGSGLKAYLSDGFGTLISYLHLGEGF